MSRQDKATTERNARTLREFVKRPENKLCADCKRNDPRWASWNLGVYLCIRCSGIHRGMGTHISKVKSIDLDTWTPEQMQSIEKWGNHRANLYWEAHLKAGHVPPDHKMESFIRSKYETRRWALDGPPPSDPSVLENGAGAQAAAPPPQQAPQPQPSSSTTQPASNFAQRTTSPVTRQPQPHQLLSSAVAADRRGQPPPLAAPPASVPQQAPPKAPEPVDDLFSLDFHAPASANAFNNGSASQPKKDVKNDILSLFSTPAAPAAPAQQFGQFQSSPWAGATTQPQAPAQPTSMIGNNGTGAWGVSSGWSAPAPAPPAQGNLWGNPTPAAAPPTQKQPDLFGGDIWGSSTTSTSIADPWASTGTTGTTQKKDDAFGDLWK